MDIQYDERKSIFRQFIKKIYQSYKLLNTRHVVIMFAHPVVIIPSYKLFILMLYWA